MSQASEQGGFDAKAATWDSNPAVVSAAHAVAEALKSSGLLQPSTSVLELGCGTGLLAELLADSIGCLVGVDTSQGMAAVFKKKLAARPDNKLHCLLTELTDAESLSKASGVPAGGGSTQLPDRFDLVLSHLTLHHIQDIPGVLRLLKAYLKPGGSIAVSDFLKEPHSTRFHDPQRMAGVYHPGGFALEEMAQYLREAGFCDAEASIVGSFQKQAYCPEEMAQFKLFLATGRVE